MTVFEKLAHIQSELKAPKNQFNKFGNYHYRNQEDILEAVKPLLKKYGVVLTVQDKIQVVGDMHQRFYVEAEAKLTDLETGQTVSTTAYAREDQEKKGMDLSQLTGATSSYARKYALNGLFLIDDTEDADAKDNRPEAVKNTPFIAPISTPKPIETPKVETVPQAPVSPLANEINEHMKDYQQTFDGGLPKAPTFNCGDCNAVVSEKVFKFSSERLGRPMCFNCQNKAKGTN